MQRQQKRERKILISPGLILFFFFSLFSSFFLFSSPALSAAIKHHSDSSLDFRNTKNKEDEKTKRIGKASDRYYPYLEIGGAKYFNQKSNVASVAGIYDLFIPLYQQKGSQIFFTDLRVFDRAGSSFEGNAHIGYRKLYPASKQMLGIYGAFDRKRSENRNLYTQLTFGAEYWRDKLFIGGNFYRPIGRQPKPEFEKAMAGFDAELGFAFTEDFTGYAGGYYFNASGTDTFAGPKARVTYSYKHPNGRMLLGLVDGMSIEVGAEHDKPRGFTGYIGLKFKAGLTRLEKNSNIFGFERHMVDLVRRDPDIRTVVVTETTTRRVVVKKQPPPPPSPPKDSPPKESPKEPPKDSDKEAQDEEPKMDENEL